MRRPTDDLNLSMAASSRPNPFPGLRPFEEDEDHLFFGREDDLDELLRRLRTTRFLAVLGTSGSGKSSLVRSGLIPSLQAGFMSHAGSSWRIAVMRPGEDPIGNLAAALNGPGILGGDHAGDAEAALHLALIDSTLRRGDLGLVETVREARLPEQDRVLLVVDQFEELFRFKRSRKTAGSHDQAVAFVQLLLKAARQEQVPIYVAITMRSDFIGNCTEIPRLTEAINSGMYLVPLLNREQRRQAISGPVAVGGATIAPRLLLRMLNDVGDDPDQMPILQHALKRTWDHWALHCTPDEPLDVEDYEGIGTMSEALSRHAEGAFAELGSERNQQIAERMFKALTTKDTDNRGVRRPCRLDELCAVVEADPQEVIWVIERFRRPGRSFLTPPAGVPLRESSVIDISHESLMRVWNRLIDWVDEEAQASRFYQRLARAAEHYEAGEAGLWTGPELATAEHWQQKAQPTAAWAALYHLDFARASHFFAESRRAEAARKAREREERARKLRNARYLAVVLGSAALLTLAFGIYALKLKAEAVANEREALALKALADEQREKALHQERLALEQERLAVEARETAESERTKADEQRELAEIERRRAVAKEREALTQKKLADEARIDADHQREKSIEARRRAEEAKAAAEASEREARRLRLVATARSLAIRSAGMAQHPQPELPALLALEAFRLNQELGGEAEDSDIYNALRLTLKRLGADQIEVLRGFDGEVQALAVSPDGAKIATGDEAGGIRVARLTSPAAAPERLALFDQAVRALAFSPDSRRLVAGSFDGALRVWDLDRPKAEPRVLRQSGGKVESLAFQPGGGRLAAGAADGLALWDLATPEARPIPLTGDEPTPIRALAFSSRGELLAAASPVRGLLLWTIPTGAGQPAGDGARVLATDQNLRSLAFNPGGNLLAGGSESGRITLWDLGRSGAAPTVLSGHSAAVNGLDFHPGHDLLASASADGSVRLWDVRYPNALPLVLLGHRFWVWTADFTPDGDRLISSSGDRTVHVWIARGRLLAEQVCKHVRRNLTAEEWSEYLPDEIDYQKSCPSLPGDPS